MRPLPVTNGNVQVGVPSSAGGASNYLVLDGNGKVPASAIPLTAWLAGVTSVFDQITDPIIQASIQAGTYTTSVTASVQAALNTGLAVHVPFGIYYFASTLKFPPNCVIIAEPGTVFRAASGLPDGFSLAQMTTMTTTVNSYSNGGLYLRGITFDGANRAMTSYIGLLRIAACSLTMTECKVINHKYIGIALHGTRNDLIFNNEFTVWGKTVAAPAEGGAAIWCADSSFDATQSTGCHIFSNYFHDGNWAAIYALGRRMTITENKILTTKECGIFAYRNVDSVSFVGDAFFDGIISKNHISGITKNTVQAAAIEASGCGCIISENILSECEGPGIDLTDPNAEVIVDRNHIYNCMKVPASPFTNYAQLNLRATNQNTVDPVNVRITGNVVRDRQGSPTAPYGLRVSNQGAPSGAMPGLWIVGNDLQGSAVLVANYLGIDAACIAAPFTCRDNVGVPAAVTVANLYPAAAVGAGARGYVTDATVTTFASVVAGGGANAVPVNSDGANWRIG